MKTQKQSLNTLLVGCIQKLEKRIQTRFFYVNKETNEVKDVTQELCEGILSFNDKAKAVLDTGNYAFTIPYTYKNGMAEYSFGCGLSHYLQEKLLKDLEETYDFSFPISTCQIAMYTPLDIRNILGVKNVFDAEIENELRERYGMKKELRNKSSIQAFA